MSEDNGQDKPEFVELEMPVNENIDAAICAGALVATIVVEWPRGSGEKRTALLFSFATHDGQILPPIVYVGDDLEAVAGLVTSAVETANDVDLDAVTLPASG